jgi:hypothetical protein
MATGRGVATVFAILAACIVVVNIDASIFYERTGGHGLLDTAGARTALAVKPPYTADQAYRLLTGWGPHGRHLYLWLTLTSDVLFPLVLCLTGLVGMRYATRNMKQRWAPAILLALPVLYLISDYAENTATIGLTVNYPTRLDSLAEFASLCYTVKNTVLTLTLLLALGGSVTRAIRNRRRLDAPRRPEMSSRSS